MKRVIKAASEPADVLSLSVGDRLELSRGYCAKRYSSCITITKSRPYDDAEYYWAKYNEAKKGWHIVRSGMIVKTLFDDEIDTLDDIVEELEMVNSTIKPKMVHN